jgi:modulator of FtsH protease
MNSPSLYRSGAAHTGIAATLGTHRVLRNTYALLSLTLLFSAAVASLSAALRLPHPGLLAHAGGLLRPAVLHPQKAEQRLGRGRVFALTGFMGYTLGPVLAAQLALPGGAQTIAMALGATGATFLALSAWVLATRRDFSFMGGFLFAGMVIAILAGLAAMFFCRCPRWVWPCRPWWRCCRPV